MATSRAIKPKRDDTQLSDWKPMPERAPSLERNEPATVARIIAMVGLFLTVLGALAMYAPVFWKSSAAISPTWGFLFATVGVCLLLYHAFVENDLQFRRLYGFFGLGLLIVGVVLRLMAFRASSANWFPFYGLPSLSIGLILVIAVVRNETEEQFRELLLNVVGGLAILMISFATVLGLRTPDYLAGEGVVLLLLGLLYAAAYIGQQKAGCMKAYYGGLALGGIGLAWIVFAVLRCMMGSTTFFIPGGLVLVGMALIYFAISMGICLDWPIVVITRRDLAAYFYSPIGYLVFIGLIFLGAFMFYLFADGLKEQGQVLEPIVGQYIFAIVPVIVQMFIVPVLTMRLLSEEKRTGTLEVLMTAPVSEFSVVMGKFLACWIFYMLSWLPLWIYLVALRYMGKESFDYLPVLSFTLALGLASSGLLAMGLFFSSMTANQIIAAVLTFVGVMAHLLFYFIGHGSTFRNFPALQEGLLFVNFFDLWTNSLQGIIAPRYLVFHLSVTIFFLFATVKMLESRKWK